MSVIRVFDTGYKSYTTQGQFYFFGSFGHCCRHQLDLNVLSERGRICVGDRYSVTRPQVNFGFRPRTAAKVEKQIYRGTPRY